MRITEMTNAEVDAAVIQTIDPTCNTFMRLCDAFTVVSDGKTGRIIDRSLQRLRRAGRIKYEKNKWVRVS